jgi:uncharacterized protein
VPREDKLIRNMSEKERSLTLAIRRAVGNEEALQKLAQQVAELITIVTTSRDPEEIDMVGRLLAELRAAAGGSKAHVRPVLEYKDCATPLQRAEFKLSSSRTRGAMEFGGYGSTFGGAPDSVGDIIQRGAFSKSLAEHRAAGTLPKLFWMHASHLVPGRWLDLHEDSHGLAAEGRLSRTTLGNELNTLIEDGAIDALSIGFVTRDSRYNSDGHRILIDIELHEVSLVSMPANPRALLTPSKAADPVDEVVAALAKLREAAQEIELPEKRQGVVVPFRAKTDEAGLDDALEKMRELSALMNANNVLMRIQR